MLAEPGTWNSLRLSPSRRYGLALFTTATAIGGTFLFQRALERFPYLPLLVGAVLVSAWVGGLGPGVLTAGVGAVAAEYLFFGGLDSLARDPALFAQLSIFVIVAALVTAVRAQRIRVAGARRSQVQRDLEERVKELTLLHRATRLLQEDTDLEALLHELVRLLPAAWQFPDSLVAQITVGDITVATPHFRATPWMQRAGFTTHDNHPGVVEVAYLRAPPGATEAPFLPEEQSLIDSLARLLTSHFERAHRASERLELARAQAARTEAETANRMKDAFLATVSHELRRPLTVILGWTRMLRSGVAGGLARPLDVIERSATIQLRLIEELLDLSRTASGDFTVTFSPLDLRDVIGHVVDAAGPSASERQVELSSHLDMDDTPVRGDEFRLQQLFGNLVGNAIKFTPGGGRVTVTLEHQAQEVVVRVADTGIGIDPTQLQAIFTPSWQVDPSTAPSREGLGLGLTIARRLAERHGGTIEAFSAGPGCGTQLTVRLPLASHCNGPSGSDHLAPEG
ncbi:MAG: ATP-binding protein [Pseudolysinimonas sp.]